MAVLNKHIINICFQWTIINNSQINQRFALTAIVFSVELLII